MSDHVLQYLLDSLTKNRNSLQGASEGVHAPQTDPSVSTSSEPEATTPRHGGYRPPPHSLARTPVWAVNSNQSGLIHGPSIPSFQKLIEVSSVIVKSHRPSHGHKKRKASPTMTSNGSPEERVRRLPNYVQVADAYIFQQTIDERLRRIGVTQAREDSMRIAGVQYIDQVRRALKLPIRTFDTACMYFHKFRLVHSDSEYSYTEAAAAALLSACKIEDTLKKSRDILCAAHNLKLSMKDHLSPDDAFFDTISRTIIGLERLMLEAAGFDFRSRHPQSLLIKLLKFFGYEKDSSISKLAFKISIDLYRTFAPLKQTTASLAFACLELAERVDGAWDDEKASSTEREYVKFKITRPMVMETLLDLLDLYNTNYRTHTALSAIPLDTFLAVRIPLNSEVDARHLPRYTEYIDIHPPTQPIPSSHSANTPGPHGNGPNGTSLNGHPAPPRGPSSGPGSGIPGAPRGPSSSKHTSPQTQLTSPSTNSSGAPGSGSTNATSITAEQREIGNINSTSSSQQPRPPGNAGVAGRTDQTGMRQRIGERGREGTVRFLLNPDREREERVVRAEYGDEGAG